jgi:hypothetical protein
MYLVDEGAGERVPETTGKDIEGARLVDYDSNNSMCSMPE